MVGIMADARPPRQGSMTEEDFENFTENGDLEELDDKNFDDPPDFVDRVSDKELVGDILAEAPKESDGLDTVIIVDNVPVVGPERLEKLKTVIRKVFSGFGKIVSEYYPMENGSTKGYVFLEYSNPMDASHAAKTADGYKLDKNHIFAVNAFSDFDKYEEVSEVWSPPEKKPYEDRGNLKGWLLDSDGNDQYAIIHAGGEQVAVLWNTPSGPIPAKERANWTDTFVRWSPQGTYLATVHQRGIALWGGSEFVRIQRYSHNVVQLMDFSPCERYLVTYSPAPDNPEDPQAIIIWDVRTGQKKRGFIAGDASQWPVFKWSHDGSYFARRSANSLGVYETPSFGLLDRKSIRVNGIRDFSWSPGTNLVAYWTPEDKDTPARVGIMQIPSRKEVRVKNLFNVADCKMYWQKKGDFLAVKVERYTKSKKAVYYNLELFKMTEKEIPVDTLEIKDPIIAFDWEPTGSKFVVIHGEAPRISASFYELEEKSMGKVTLLKKYEKKQVNSIYWAPTGQFVVLAGLRNMSGTLEFYDTGDMTCMNTGEHFMATDVEWDPTGRYVATSVSWWAHKVDNGYQVWTFQGRALQRHPMEQFCQFLWRPRPPSLLKEDDLKRIRKDLKRYQKMFELKDQKSQTKASKELIDRRSRMYADFMELRDRQRHHFFALREMRLDLRGGVDTDTLDSNLDDIEEETIEFFIKEEIESLEDKE